MILRDMFPKRKIEMCHLAHYKDIWPTSGKTQNKYGKNNYTLQDLVATAALMKIKDIGIGMKFVAEIMKIKEGR